jgi:hypothetical protein
MSPAAIKNTPLANSYSSNAANGVKGMQKGDLDVQNQNSDHSISRLDGLL